MSLHVVITPNVKQMFKQPDAQTSVISHHCSLLPAQVVHPVEEAPLLISIRDTLPSNVVLDKVELGLCDCLPMPITNPLRSSECYLVAE